MSLDRGTMGRLSVQRLSKRFSRNKDYDRVDDTSDTRVPLYNEEAFQHGLTFKAKYIGSLEISKPSSKVDIISAMRRIRYEYKVKGVKKQRCTIDVSIQGVKVTKRKRRKRKQYTEEQLFIMHHPIYRIFYVSHDSQDLKIFSYITREVPDNTFKCNVFKAYRKRMALHLVRSLGQAFDVCHKLNPRPKKKRTVLEDEKKKEEKKEKKENSENAGSKEELTTEEVSPSTDTLVPPPNTAQDNVSPEGVITDIELPPLISLDPLEPFTLAPAITPMVVGLSGLPNERPRPRPQNTIQENPMISSNDSIKPMSGGSLVDIDGNDKQASWEMERQQLKTQLTLLTDQLHAETAARIETQARVEHLLMQNKGLLAHLQKLMIQLQQLQSLQMSQLSSANKTPDKDKKRSAPVTDLTPPNTDMSEPSSSEVHLVNDTSSPHQSDDQPLLEDISVPSADSPPQSLPLNGNKEDDIIAAAFTPQLESNESESSLVDPFVPRGSNDPDPFASHESSSSKVDPDPFTPQESSNKVDPDPFTPQESSNKVDPDPFRPQDIEIIQLSVNEDEGKFTDAFSPKDDQTNLLDAFKPQELHDQPPLESTFTVSVIS